MLEVLIVTAAVRSAGPPIDALLATTVFYVLIAAALTAAVLCFQDVNTDWVDR